MTTILKNIEVIFDLEKEQVFSLVTKLNSSPWQVNDNNVWQSLFDGASEKTYKKNTIVYHEGDPLQYIYFIKQGRVRSSVFDNDGQEKTILIFSEGTIFGEVSAIEQGPYQVTTTTNTACTLAYLPYMEFLEKVGNSPLLSKQLYRSLTQKIVRLSAHIKDISFLNSDERVVSYLMKLADTFGEKTEHGLKISISFTHQELADLIAVSRVTVSKVMSLLSKEGIIVRIDGYVFIKDKVELIQWLMIRNDQRL